MIRNNMLAIAAFATLLGTVGTAAQAYEGEGFQTQQVASSRTRAEVKAEALQANQGVNLYGYSYNPVAGVQSVRSRADVRAEAVAANQGYNVAGETLLTAY